MPCNPAVGGTAKGHLVREIDALGGLMGRAIDATGIQFKLLNRSRGPAVWSPRAQADKRVRRVGEGALEREPNIEWMIGKAGRILVEHGRVVGLALEDGDAYAARARRDDRHVPERACSHRPRAAAGGPRRRAAVARSRRIAEVVRLRVGPAEDRHAAAARSREHRLRSAVADGFRVERGDDPPVPFSFLTTRSIARRSTAHLLHTNDRVRDLVRANIGQSPLFNGQIAASVRATARRSKTRSCGSRHRSGTRSFSSRKARRDEIYVNGFSMSLPRDVQADLVHALPGLEDAVMLRPGYAVEYDFIQPTELTRRSRPSASRALSRRADQRHVGLRGSGGAGLVAGINAARARARRDRGSSSAATRRTSASSSTI
jgi:tRNA uridine 5-carboxymethylaminomethyl modification enzyme